MQEDEEQVLSVGWGDDLFREEKERHFSTGVGSFNTDTVDQQPGCMSRMG
jgi:hypothetical protein